MRFRMFFEVVRQQHIHIFYDEIFMVMCEGEAKPEVRVKVVCHSHDTSARSGPFIESKSRPPSYVSTDRYFGPTASAPLAHRLVCQWGCYDTAQACEAMRTKTTIFLFRSTA